MIHIRKTFLTVFFWDHWMVELFDFHHCAFSSQEIKLDATELSSFTASQLLRVLQTWSKMCHQLQRQYQYSFRFEKKSGSLFEFPQDAPTLWSRSNACRPASGSAGAHADAFHSSNKHRCPVSLRNRSFRTQ